MWARPEPPEPQRADRPEQVLLPVREPPEPAFAPVLPEQLP